MNLEVNKENIRKYVKTILKVIFAISVILILGYAIKKYFFSGKVALQTGGLTTMPSEFAGAPVTMMGIGTDADVGVGVGTGIVENIQLKQANSTSVNNMLRLFK
jgi:hypothetical protein